MHGVNYFGAVVQKVMRCFGIGNDCRRDVETVFLPVVRSTGAAVPAV
jgi:hypothetical protein